MIPSGATRDSKLTEALILRSNATRCVSKDGGVVGVLRTPTEWLRHDAPVLRDGAVRVLRMRPPFWFAPAAVVLLFCLSGAQTAHAMEQSAMNHCQLVKTPSGKVALLSTPHDGSKVIAQMRHGDELE
eukprot:gene44645-60460_t